MAKSGESKKSTNNKKGINVVDGDQLKVSNKLTEKEIVARKIQRYASLNSFENRMASISSMYSDVINSSQGNFYSPQLSTDFLEKPQNLRERRAWYRHFYNSNEFVGQAIDLHSTLPLSKIRLEKPECKNQEQANYVYDFFIEMCNELKLFKILLEISHEYHLFGNCVPGYVDIRTSEGLKRADSIKKGDFVLTNRGRYRKVINTTCRIDNRLVKIKCDGYYQDLITTPEHPIEVYRDDRVMFVKAADVKNSDYLLLSYPTGDFDIENEHSHKITKEFAYLAGYWLGNGVVYPDNRCGFVVDVKNEELLNKLKNVLYLVFNKDNITIKDCDDSCCIYFTGERDQIKWWKNIFEGIDCNSKRIPAWFTSLPVEILKHFLFGIIDSCQTELTEHSIDIFFESQEVANIVRDIIFKCGFVCKYDCIKKGDYKTRHGIIKITYYKISICNKSACLGLVEGSVKKFLTESSFFEEDTYMWKRVENRVAVKVKEIETVEYNNIIVYNFEVEEDHTYSVNGYSTHNCFIYAEDHNPYELDDENIVNELKEKGKIEAQRLFKEFNIIDKDPNYKGWKKLIILPPDQVRIKKIPLSDESFIEYIPDPETRKVIMSAQQQVSYYDSIEEEKTISKIPKDLSQSLQSSGSIPLDTDPYSGSYVYHLARKKSQYETLGVSVLERCINTLLLQDKLRQVQTQIASRHMTPIRIVWSDKISDFDVEALREQVDLALVDPDYSIVTNFEVHWDEMGSNGRLLELSSEYEHIENSLFAGLGVTRELLTGEGTYAGNRITLEILNTQYLLFRALLQEYVEDYLFKPVAKKKGFIEKDKYGREKLIYPKLSFTRLAIKDNDSFFDQAMQLYQKGSIAIDVILDTLNIDPVSTKKKIEADLFTTNDFAFNQLMSNIYANVSQILVEKYNIPEKLADYLKLDPVQQPEQQGGGEGLGGLGGLGGRFASELPKEKQEALNKLIQFLVKNPEKLNKLLSHFDNKDVDINKGGT